MKFNCGLTESEKIALKTQKALEKSEAEKVWHVRFAWLPIRLTGTHTCVWLEHLEARRGEVVHQTRGNPWIESYWEFRACKPSPMPK
jgi:hypothetical protein